MEVVPSTPSSTVPSTITTSTTPSNTKVHKSLARPGPPIRRPMEDGDRIVSVMNGTTNPNTGGGGGSPLDSLDRFFTRTGVKDKIEGAKEGIMQLLDRVRSPRITCLNGGSPQSDGRSCQCLPRFSGNHCENIVCFNGGTSVMLSGGKVACRCEPERFISGNHCEILRCDHNGVVTADGSGCVCTTLYTGKFCEDTILTTNAHLIIPSLALLIIIFCCCICRMDLCPRRRSSPRDTRRMGGRPRRGDGEGVSTRGGDPRPLLSVPSFPPSIPSLPHQSSVATSSGAFVIRLDTIPTFNPDMVGAPIDDGKTLDPPPPYEEALSAAVTAPGSDLQPPRYEERAPGDSELPRVGGGRNGGRGGGRSGS